MKPRLPTPTLRACVAALGAAGCGANTPEVPPGLLDAIEASRNADAAAGDYPPGPYGSAEGDVVRNLSFDGWTNPTAARYEPEKLRPIAFSAFHDPDGDEIELLMVNTIAIWCIACRAEHGGTGERPSLREHLRRRETRGFRLISLLFQDAEGEPATREDAARWAQALHTDFPFGVDPDFRMGEFSDPAVQPFNMVIDARTMEIVLEVEGDQPAVLWPRVDALLDGRASQGD